MPIPETEVLTSIVSRVFHVEQVITGDAKKGWFLRYQGSLLLEAAQAYEQLAEALHPHDVTPLFRVENGQQVILLLAGTVRIKPGRASVNIGLFLLTLLSVMLAGAMYSYTGPLPCDFWGQIKTLVLNIWTGWPFALSLLAILLAHEFGHYFIGRARGAAVSLPYFIPFPLSILGTMGAFIQLKQFPKNRRALFDLGIAGPLAGLIVAVPVVLLGLSFSEVSPLENTYYVKGAGQCEICENTALTGESYSCPEDNFLEGNSILYLGLKYIVKGRLLPSPANTDSASLFSWLQFLFTGHPVPVGGMDVMIHPVAMAGWAGLLVTFLNLIPAGQLDGGHVLYAVFGKRGKAVLPVILVCLVALGFFWTGWWLWAVLIFLLGRAHAEPLDEITGLDTKRKVMAVAMLVIFLLVLAPVPFTIF